MKLFSTTTRLFSILNKSSTHKLPQRKIGNDTVPAIGLGLMGMSSFYKHNEDPAEAERKHLEVLTRAADLGETFWDTSDIYGPFTNEELIGKWFKQTGRRKEIFLATKFGVTLDQKTRQVTARGDREYIRQAIEGSLKRLGTDYVDLYYQHRVDKNTRIEDTVSALAELVKEGKVRHLGISECSANTLRRAHKVHPIGAVQMEYSLFSLDIEHSEIGIKKACDELDVAIVAYAPLGRGLLTGRFKSRSDFMEGDWRLNQPRFSEENFNKNLEVVEKVIRLSEKKMCTPSQLALAWLLKQGDNVIPIPGTRQLKNLEENVGALKITLTDKQAQEIREVAEKADIRGARYDVGSSSRLFADTI